MYFIRFLSFVINRSYRSVVYAVKPVINLIILTGNIKIALGSHVHVHRQKHKHTHPLSWATRESQNS